MRAQPGVNIEPLLTRKQVAELLGVSETKVRREIQARRLRQVKLGRLVRIDPQDLRDYICLYREGVAGNVGTPYIPGLFLGELGK